MTTFFDSLTHPTITGTLNDCKVDFGTVKDEMLKYGFQWACAVGLHGVENYNHEDFICECIKHDCFIPPTITIEEDTPDTEIEVVDLTEPQYTPGYGVEGLNEQVSYACNVVPLNKLKETIIGEVRNPTANQHKRLKFLREYCNYDGGSALQNILDVIYEG